MKKFQYIFVFFSLLSITNLAQTQSDSVIIRLKAFAHNIEQFRLMYPQEKVYLHFDNTGYYLGETIWYKAYVVNACDNSSIVQSKVLYVELLNSRGVVLESKKLEIINGQSHGDFYLTTFNYDYHPGYYEIRAYTKNMLNFGEETVFSRVFPVFNEPVKEGQYTVADLKEGRDVNRLNLPWDRKKTKKQRQVNIDFYPEGGNLVSGLNNRLAFKITNENGIGINASGCILNNKNEFISELSSVHEGMGVLDYIPDGSKNEVQVRYENRTYQFNLPQSVPSGYSMQINSLLAKDIMLMIFKTPSMPDETLGITIMCRGKLLHFMTIQSKNYPMSQRILKSELSVGVNQITLFNSRGEIYAERLVFISPSKKDEYIIKTKADKKSYNWQQKINLDFTAKRGMTFSLAVRDASNTPQTSDAGNILTNLLLSSDLKGYIENPSYYFASPNIECQKALDLLMMVQGWKRYEWQQMTGVQAYKPKYEPEKKLMINGHLGGESKDRIGIKTVNLEIALNKNYLTAATKVDSTGSFSLSIDTTLYGSFYMYLEASGLTNADRNIRLDRWFSPTPKTYTRYEITNFPNEKIADNITIEDKQLKNEDNILTRIKEQNDTISRHYEIREVNVKGKRGKDLIYNVERDRDKAVDLGKDYPENAFYYMVQKNNGFFFKGALDLPDNVAGGSGQTQWQNYGFILRYMVNDRKWKYITYDSRYPTLHGGSRAEFVDLEQIKKIIIREWEVKSEFSTHSYIPGYLYPYDKTVYYLMRKTPAYRVTSFEGYSDAKDFYVDRPERENYIPPKTDHSRTLYWNPDVKTDSEGNAKVSFYNNAWCKIIEISAEGVTKEGIPMVNK